MCRRNILIPTHLFMFKIDHMPLHSMLSPLHILRMAFCLPLPPCPHHITKRYHYAVLVTQTTFHVLVIHSSFSAATTHVNTAMELMIPTALTPKRDLFPSAPERLGRTYLLISKDTTRGWRTRKEKNTPDATPTIALDLADGNPPGKADSGTCQRRRSASKLLEATWNMRCQRRTQGAVRLLSRL